VDFEKVRAEGIPEIEWLDAPYIPRGAHLQIVGPTEASKSMWVQWRCAVLSRMGIRVVYIQGENPFAVEFDRWERLKPDHKFFTLYHLIGELDLANEWQAEWIRRISKDADLVVLDTWTSFWSKGEGNEETIEYENVIVAPIKSHGTTLVTIHHEGHPQQFGQRKGSGAGRGGSAQGQKADVVLDFDATKEPNEFVINHGKAARFSKGKKEPARRYRVIDTEDGGLDVEELGEHVPEGMLECAGKLREVIEAEAENRTMTFRRVQDAGRQLGFGTETVSKAMEFLKAGEDVQVLVGVPIVNKAGGTSKGNLWLPAGAQ
jgi:hypothetical protein